MSALEQPASEQEAKQDSLSASTGSLFGPRQLLQAAKAPEAETQNLCDIAAQQAAEQSDVPLSVLRAITLTETGRRRDGQFQAWPWTVNKAGRGVWFETREEAEQFSLASRAEGELSFDVGCFQINYRWHGSEFQSIQAMFDPATNARYAAQFLTNLYAETGDWSRAAGAYHSRTERFASRYRNRFDEIRAALPPMAEGSNSPGPLLRETGIPLAPVSQLGASTTSVQGSLVPPEFARTGSLPGFGAAQ